MKTKPRVAVPVKPRPPKRDYDPTIAVRVPPATRAELEEIQRNNYPNMSELLKSALRDFIKKHKPQSGA